MRLTDVAPDSAVVGRGAPILEADESRTSGRGEWKMSLAVRFSLPLAFLAGLATWFYKPASFIADDSYFYPVIARHLARSGQQTFSTLYSTNGVHPLWLYLLTAYSAVIRTVDPSALYKPGFAVPLSAVVTLAGGYALVRAGEALALNRWLVAAVPVAFVMTSGVLYSEVHLLFCTISLLTLVAVNPRLEEQIGSLGVGLCTALVILSRLDAVFFIACFYLWYALERRGWIRALKAGSICGALIAGYSLWNAIAFGGIVPVSGWLKSSFPHITLKSFEYSGLATSIGGVQILFGLLPVLLGFLCLPMFGRLKGACGIWYVYLGGASLEVAYLALYGVYSVNWYWYFLLPVMLASLTVCLLVHRLRHRTQAESLLLLAIALGMIGALFLHRPAGLPCGENALKFVRSHNVKEKVLLVSDCPGCLAFYSDNRIIAADLLTANRPLINSMLESADGLDYLANFLESHGHRIDYVFELGGPWLRTERGELTLADRPLESSIRIIGRRQLASPVYIAPDRSLVVWKWK